ncbi:MAG: hypothetical protein VXW30_03770 [Candidatus Thermoplasmatota archaeon]|nr:hypothetical protein [Candidatus Thermoplasmatota archaeon]MEC7462259.1 hypothetical protein [Candidatus Thermoplasmatota archaeon]MEC7544393.1 hypothetical protein [Candidatus Thermoplasmatota archaeon]MEC8384039.1 hypothetical protein [Candidatus Thermoplasmatota archaeon]MEC8721306.1 hypothetical protein [Candidatus Thermoplasmatota archaeon]
MEDPLDDYLSSIDKRSLKKPKLVINHIRDAYPIGIPALSIKSTTDRIGLDAGYSFHLGTPEPELRRIASWIFTHISHSEKIENIIGRLWKRFGREDLVLSSILLANLPDKEVDSNWKWITLAELISHIEKKRGRIPLEVMLLHIEEMSRADCSMIDEIFASKLLEGTIAEQYLGILGMHQFSKKNNISNSIKEKLENIDLPDGDSLIRRIRNKTLE